MLFSLINPSVNTTSRYLNCASLYLCGCVITAVSNNLKHCWMVVCWTEKGKSKRGKWPGV